MFAGTLTCGLFVLVTNVVRGSGVDRSMALLAACGAVMVPATVAFVIVAESERRLYIRTRGRRMAIPRTATA